MLYGPAPPVLGRPGGARELTATPKPSVQERFDPMDDESAQFAESAPRAEAARSEIRRRFADAFRLRPWIYWADMIGSACLGWALFATALLVEP